MKLRNKKTGEIKEVEPITIGGFRSLAELNEEWEDYEEPKEYWFIDACGEVEITDRDPDDELAKQMQSIGNYFKTKEEAEKAVEKLRAFKRLKDKGFRFDGYDSGHNSNKELCGQAYFKAGNFWFDIKADLDLLFGGEE